MITQNNENGFKPYLFKSEEQTGLLNECPAALLQVGQRVWVRKTFGVVRGVKRSTSGDVTYTVSTCDQGLLFLREEECIFPLPYLEPDFAYGEGIQQYAWVRIFSLKERLRPFNGQVGQIIGWLHDLIYVDLRGLTVCCSQGELSPVLAEEGNK